MQNVSGREKYVKETNTFNFIFPVISTSTFVPRQNKITNVPKLYITTEKYKSNATVQESFLRENYIYISVAGCVCLLFMAILVILVVIKKKRERQWIDHVKNNGGNKHIQYSYNNY